MLRIGILLIGGVAVVTGTGLALLSVMASGAASSLGSLVSCAPTLPPEDEAEQGKEKEKSESS